MSATSKGARAEGRAKAIMRDCGFTLVSEAKRSPVWKHGRIIANNGNVDLLAGAVDLVFVKFGRRVLFVQVCHRGGESPRRQKLRAAPLDPTYCEALLMAFDLDFQHFRIFRAVDDYKEKGWTMHIGDTSFPWEHKTQQETIA